MKLIDRKLYYGKSGIYSINSLIDSRVYIGSAINLYRRCGNHKDDLTNGTHYNSKLQRFANKYGIENLEFTILEICNKEELKNREDYYITITNCVKLGFNILSKAYSNLGVKFSKESIEKRVASNKFNLSQLSKEKRLSRDAKVFKNRSDGKKGIKQSEEHIRNRTKRGEDKKNSKLNEEKVKEIILLIADGFSLDRISRLYNISFSSIYDIKENRTWKHIDRKNSQSNYLFLI